MSESSESFVDDRLILLTNAEYSKLKRNYFEMNPTSHQLDVGLELNDFGFVHNPYLGDDVLNLFTITDKKKFEYSKIKYEF